MARRAARSKGHPVSPSTPARWSEAQIRASLETSLAHWDRRSPLWVFGYGSLIWRPEFEFEAREPARIHGYHRRLCEMFLGSYRPTWMRAQLLRGATVEALAFVVRRDAFNYGGRLADDELVDILSRACGSKGSSLEYLQRTVAALHEAGLRDPHLERLMHEAEGRRSIAGDAGG